MEDQTRRGYAICGEQRTGSTFLAQMLASTGRLGVPREFFSVNPMRRYVDPNYPADPEAQLGQVLPLGSTANGVYGLTVFTGHFDDARRIRWAERLPNLAFVHLRRRDLLGQALSLVRAQQTDQYHSHRPKAGEPLYDRGRINEALVGLARTEARWRYWFARNGLDPLMLDYEDLAERPLEAVGRIAVLVGVSGEVTVDFDKVANRVQRDDQTEDWRQRFLAESRNLAVFN